MSSELFLVCRPLQLRALCTQLADPHSLCSSTKCPHSEACVCAQGFARSVTQLASGAVIAHNCTACSSFQPLKAGECQNLNHTQSNSEHENEECADSCLTCLERRPVLHASQALYWLALLLLLANALPTRFFRPLLGAVCCVLPSVALATNRMIVLLA